MVTLPFNADFSLTTGLRDGIHAQIKA
jgi:hypothetical protein